MEPYWDKSEKAVEMHEARSANQLASVDLADFSSRPQLNRWKKFNGASTFR